ncbi:2-phospho-L-lactate transferase [Flavisphingomonas formosensis]|uniref:2-phospho-L-lactate transferase n=1 Tax=Flavisphingomonas formosensis TaxID=861534 RepID=UPI0012FC1DB9|nr:2-phospho-L-lactate transferase [Sphingomonas formosensis]
MKVTVLTGGVGGAKLVLGLAHALPPADVTAIVNTGDDFTHLGLRVSPDIDTLLYTLSGKANTAQGWGREGESWSFMDAVRSLAGEDWFALGDGDLALHVLRTARLAAGEPLSTIVGDFARRWGIASTVLPMTDDAVATILDTDEGELAFQRYFVARRCEPRVKAIRFEGADRAHPAPGALSAIAGADAILIAPSNPFLSVDPLLAVPGLRQALADAQAPVVAISPLVGGRAVKGPTGKLMVELGVDQGVAAITAHYQGVIDGMLVDERDAPADLGIASARTDTLMLALDDRIRVARSALAFARSLRR